MYNYLNIMKEKEAAEYLLLSIHTLRKDRQRKAPTIPFTTIGGSVRYLKSDLDKVLKDNKKG